MSPREEKLKLAFDENYTALVYFASKTIGSESEAEDVVQDVFIKYWNQQDNIAEDRSVIKSYLYTAVRNACLNLIRRRSVSDKYTLFLAGKEFSERDALDLMLEAETLSIVFRAMEELPPVCGKITRMSYLQGKKNEEIAAELGISVNSVKTHKQRGMQLLRKKLSPAILGILVALF